jgi:hypothetical protein
MVRPPHRMRTSGSGQSLSIAPRGHSRTHRPRRASPPVASRQIQPSAAPAGVGKPRFLAPRCRRPLDAGCVIDNEIPFRPPPVRASRSTSRRNPLGPPLLSLGNRGSGSRVIRRVRLAQAFEVFDELVAAGLDGSIHARPFDHGDMDFTVSLALIDRTQEQLGVLAAVVERHDLELDVDDHRHASLK